MVSRSLWCRGCQTSSGTLYGAPEVAHSRHRHVLQFSGVCAQRLPQNLYHAVVYPQVRVRMRFETFHKKTRSCSKKKTAIISGPSCELLCRRYLLEKGGARFGARMKDATHDQKHTYTYTYMHVHIRRHTYTFTHTKAYICIHIMFIYIYIYAYIYIYTYADTYTYTQTPEALRKFGHHHAGTQFSNLRTIQNLILRSNTESESSSIKTCSNGKAKASIEHSASQSFAHTVLIWAPL